MNKLLFYFYDKMQIDRNSDLVYYNEDGKSLSYFEYKAGDYISDNEFYKLFSYVLGKIHSTGGNFYILELAMGNKNKNNKDSLLQIRCIITQLVKNQ
jgi:hypothetical protein